MLQLFQAIPDHQVLLALEPEELGAKLLFLLRQRGGNFVPGNLENELWGFSDRPSYPRNAQAEIGLALAEAWSWLEAQGLVVPESGINGQNGWRRLSRRARRMESEADFASYKIARLLPRDILHPKMAEQVWMANENYLSSQSGYSEGRSKQLFRYRRAPPRSFRQMARSDISPSVRIAFNFGVRSYRECRLHIASAQ